MKIHTIITLGTLLFISSKTKVEKVEPCHDFAKICEHYKDYQLFKVIERPNIENRTLMMTGCYYVRQSKDNSFTLVPYGGYADTSTRDTLAFLDKYFYPENTHKIFKRDTVDSLKIQYNGKDYYAKCEIFLFGPNTVSCEPQTIQGSTFCNSFYIKPLPVVLAKSK